jgi:hypothetical protein
MLKRNYESLKEASQHLQKTMNKHCQTKGKNYGTEKTSAVRSLKNMKNQALAGLVIRKNVIKRKKPPPTTNDQKVPVDFNPEKGPVKQEDA